MFLVLALGAGLGMYAAKVRREALRSWAIVALSSNGAQLEYNGNAEVTRILWFGGSINPASLPQVQIGDEASAALGMLDQLEELDTVVGVLTDAGLTQLGRLPRLRRVYAFKPNVTDAGLAHLKGSSSLRDLALLRVPAITDAGLVHLASLTGLQELNLSGARISGPGLAHLARMGQLRSLILPNTPLTDTGLAHLGRLTSLKQLYIGGDSGEYTDAGVAHLSRLNGLTDLGLGSKALSENALAHIARMKRLEILNLHAPQMTPAWLDLLAGMTTLRRLDVTSANLSDTAIERLHQALPQLQVTVGGRPR